MSDAAATDPPVPDASLRKRARVVVVGSANTDMVARVARLPRPGETVLGHEFESLPGGKGANQAVAAARLGAVVTFVACVGADALGDGLVLGLEAEGIHTRYVVRDPDAPTGVALITVDEATGENVIVVASGANAKLSVGLVEMAGDAIRAADVLVCQLESPLETVTAALKLAREAGKTTILNPAPAQPLTDELLSLVSVLTPNETEAALLAGNAQATPEAAAATLRAKGVERLVVTLGAEGALLVTEDGRARVPGRAVPQVVDTTAAGDCFTGALAVGLGEEMPPAEAAAFANAAAALSVTKAGAQPSLPSRFETEQFLAA
jgi:ribokinase